MSGDLADLDGDMAYADHCEPDWSTIVEFRNLFEGRTDAHGAWHGAKLDGPPNFVSHLTNGPYVGVYCVDDDNTVKWGCIDIDGKDFALDHDTQTWDWEAMWKTANQLVDALAYKGCVAWTERTTNGIHLWVFIEERVPAYIVRRALLAACDVIGYTPKEVNPKQEEVNPDKPYGNYVRLPYYGALVDQPADRFVIDEDGRPLDVNEFCQLSEGSLNDLATLEHMAALYTPPPAPDIEVNTTRSADMELMRPIIPPVVWAIYEDGPLDPDRSAALVKAAVLLRNEGWRAQGIYQVLDAIDARLGKFVGRDDREQQLLNIIEKVLT